MDTNMQGASPGTTDAIELLKHDHKKVQMLFDQYESLRNQGNTDSAQKQRIVEQICQELTVHAQIEEEIFYPAVRQSIDDEELVDEAEDEHAEAKEYIAELQSMQPDDADYDTTVLSLAKAVMHHVQEEESEMFTEARGAIDPVSLGQQLMQRKQQLQMQMGSSQSGGMQPGTSSGRAGLDPNTLPDA